MQIHRGGVNSQFFLYQIGGGRTIKIGSKCSDNHQVNVPNVDTRILNGPEGSLNAQITGGLLGSCVATRLNSRTLFDPRRIATKLRLQIRICDNVIGNVRTRADHLDSHE